MLNLARCRSRIYVKSNTLVYVKMYVDILGPWITIEYFKTLLSLLYQPNDAIWLIDTCEPFFLDEINLFHTIIWNTLLDRFLEGQIIGNTFNDEAWCCVARRFSHSIYNAVFTQMRYTYPLMIILLWAETPLESQLFVREWLEFLNRSGVDLVRYLEKESKALEKAAGEQSDPFFRSGMYRRVMREADWGGLKFPFWELKVQEPCPIRELVMEYPYIAPRGYAHLLRFRRLAPYYLFILGGGHAEDIKEQWPIQDTEINAFNSTERGIRQGLADSRFNRKQLKKLRKRRKLEGGFSPEQEMPGTWRDEFDI